jgi:ribonuclease Z
MGGVFGYALIPLILSIGIIPVIPFSEAADYSQICIDKVWLEGSKGRIACVSSSTAEKLVERGWGTVLSEDDLIETPEPVIPYTEGMEIDYEFENTLKPFIDGGTEAMTATPILGNPTKEYPYRYVPGTEELDANEMRVTMCGTGMPILTPYQAGACVLIETGDGKAYIFDIGSGSVGRLNTLAVDPNELNKVFVGHLHTDHVGDLMYLWSQAFLSGRTVPLEVWGPSGPAHELGTSFFVEKQLESYQWDEESRVLTGATGQKINPVHEFEWSKTQVIYDEDGFSVVSFPAIHSVDGAVSFRIDWKDITVVFSSDTNANTFLIENSQDADLFILETFPSTEMYAKKFGWPVELVKKTVSVVHTQPDKAGLVFEITEPKMGVLYHQLLDEEVAQDTFKELRKNYAGPATFAEDYTTFNITPDYIVTRIADPVINPFPQYTEAPAEGGIPTYGISEWLQQSGLSAEDLKEMLAEKNEN